MASTNELTVKRKRSYENEMASTNTYQNELSKQSSAAFYLEHASADVFFVFSLENGEQRRVPAHKIVLATRSPVFRRMFYGALPEGTYIKIVNTTEAEFIEFLQFFYLENVTLTLENVAQVTNLVNQYEITKCFDICEQFIIKHLTLENACTGLDIAVLFDRNKLKELCAKTIRSNALILLASQDFVQLSKNVLKVVLESIVPNKDLATATFFMCVEWAKQKCEDADMDPSNLKNCKQQLRDIFHLIPFEKMTQKDVKHCVKWYEELFDYADFMKLIQRSDASSLWETGV